MKPSKTQAHGHCQICNITAVYIIGLVENCCLLVQTFPLRCCFKSFWHLEANCAGWRKTQFNRKHCKCLNQSNRNISVGGFYWYNIAFFLILWVAAPHLRSLYMCWKTQRRLQLAVISQRQTVWKRITQGADMNYFSLSAPFVSPAVTASYITSHIHVAYCPSRLQFPKSHFKR